MKSRAVLVMRPEPRFRRDAFEAGLKACGYRVEIYTTANDVRTPFARGDVLVVWTRHEPRYGDLCAQCEAAMGTVLVAENGYLAKAPFQMREYFAISRDDHNGAGWFPYCDDVAPPKSRWDALGVELQPKISGSHPDAHIIVREQRGIGSSVMASPPDWHMEMVRRLRKVTGRRIIVRSHPGFNNPERPLGGDLKGCHVVVTWASSLAVRALVLGADVAILAPHHVLAPRDVTNDRGLRVTETQLFRRIGSYGVVQSDRLRPLWRMAWAQWHVSEIADGLPFRRLIASEFPPRS